MQLTPYPHGEVLGRSHTVMAEALAMPRPSLEPRTTQMQVCRYRCSLFALPSRGDGSLRSASCVVRGSPLGGRRARVQGSARLAPHHEARGSSRIALARNRPSENQRFHLSIEFEPTNLVCICCLPGRTVPSPEVGPGRWATHHHEGVRDKRSSKSLGPQRAF